MLISRKEITLAPLPSWKSIFHALFRLNYNIEDLKSIWLGNGDIGGWFSRSSWSIAQIAVWRETLKDSKPIIWVPDFFCDSTLHILRLLEVKLVFYPINSLFHPDYTMCRQMARQECPDIFILVHYFANPTPAAMARDFCQETGAWLIEDGAHVLRPISKIGKYGDFVLYSQHKLLSIPDGALLIVRTEGPSKFSGSDLSLFNDPLSWANKLKEHDKLSKLKLHQPKNLLPIWLIKRCLQKIGIRFKYKPADFDAELSSLSNINLVAPQISNFSLRMMHKLLPDINKIGRWRLCNKLLWDDIITNISDNLKPLIVDKSKYEEIPYLACYELINLERKFATYAQLQKLGLPVITWPDLPSEIFSEHNNFSMAWKLRHSYIYLPVHQSIKPHQLQYLFGGLYKKNIRSAINKNIRLDWNKFDLSQWHNWLCLAKRSNLLQSYEYGNAKTKAENWEVKRGVFYIENSPVAIVQVLTKTFAGFLTLNRVNRGPLFLIQVDDSIKLEIIKQLTKELSKKTFGKVFIFTPELIFSGRSMRLLFESKIRQIQPISWQSAFLNLSLSEKMLRDSLHGKWRNMLVFAEKQKMQIYQKNDQKTYENLLRNYIVMMAQRKAGNVSYKLYLSLYKELKKSSCPLIIFVACEEDNIMSGIVIVPHGVSATYLLGWSNESGRKIRANYILLWKAILYLKQQGFLWFDLGGVDNLSVPSITAFKQGLGGESYTLVGSGLG